MALTATEAAAGALILRSAAGWPGIDGNEIHIDDLRLAVETLYGAVEKKLAATAMGDTTVDQLADSIIRRSLPNAPTSTAGGEAGDDDVAVRSTGPLTPIDGIVPVELVTKVRGASQHIGREVHLDETIWFCGQAEVDDVSLKRTKQGPKRHQVLLITALFELPERSGRRLLNTLKEQYRLGEPATLPFKAAHDEQLVESLGLAAGPESVVVIFADETRAVWPDDWATPPGRPHPGERVAMPGAKASEDPGLVGEILDLAGSVLEQLDDEVRHDTDDDLDPDAGDARDEDD